MSKTDATLGLLHTIELEGNVKALTKIFANSAAAAAAAKQHCIEIYQYFKLKCQF